MERESATSAYERRLFVSLEDALEKRLDDKQRQRLRSTWPVYKHDEHGRWVKSPVHVLRGWLHEMQATVTTTSLHEWGLFTSRGTQWVAKQALVYPDIARDARRLFNPLTDADGTAARFGRPVDYRVLDEWTLMPDQTTQLMHGGLGDAGGEEQHMGLYWEDGRGLEGLDLSVAMIDSLDIAFRMSLHSAMTQLGSSATVM